MSNPIRRHASALSGTGALRRIFTDDEVKRLKKAADQHSVKYALIVRLLLEYAMRVTELTHLKLSDFNERSLPPTITVQGVKGGFRKDYEIPDKLWRRYKRWLKLRTPQESPWVFPSRLYPTQPMTTMGVQGTFYELLKAAGIEGRHSVHDCRHHACTRAARLGDSPYQIAQLLRHRDLASAATYLDFVDDKAHDRVRAARYED